MHMLFLALGLAKLCRWQVSAHLHNSRFSGPKPGQSMQSMAQRASRSAQAAVSSWAHERCFMQPAMQVYDEFCRRAAEATARMRQGAASGAALVDAGAMCMPGAAAKVQELVDDAVAKGAKVGGWALTREAGRVLVGAGGAEASLQSASLVQCRCAGCCPALSRVRSARLALGLRR